MAYTITPAPGTISIVAGGVAIVGIGTVFTAYNKGAIINVPGFGAGQLAATPSDDLAATLVMPISASAITGKAFGAWAQPDPSVYSPRVRELLDKLGDLAAVGLQPNAIGDVADRADFDGQGKGYVYLTLDGDDSMLSVKNSATAGDWTDIQLTGPQGSPGIVGDEYAIDIGSAGGADLTLTGRYPAALSIRADGQLTRFFGEVGAGSGSVTVQVLLNGTAVVSSQVIAAGSPVTVTGLAIDIAEGDRLDFEIVSYSGSVKWVWLQLDGPIEADQVVGPASAVDNRLVAFDGTTGKLLKDGGVIVDADGTLAANSDARLATQKAARTYVAAGLATKLGLAGGALTGNLELAAGTTSLAPLTLQSGPPKTTATAGDVEFDGKAFYANSVAGARQVVTAEQVSVLTTDFTGTNVNTAQPVFSTGQDVLAVQASTTYEFEAEYEIDTTGTTSHSLGVLFALGGGASLTSIAYRAMATNGAARGTPSAPAVSRIEVATVSNVTAAVAAATQNTVSLRGVIRINAGGTLTPQFQYSAAPGAAPTIRANSFFRLWPIGSNTVAAVGAWS